MGYVQGWERELAINALGSVTARVMFLPHLSWLPFPPLRERQQQNYSRDLVSQPAQHPPIHDPCSYINRNKLTWAPSKISNLAAFILEQGLSTKR